MSTFINTSISDGVRDLGSGNRVTHQPNVGRGASGFPHVSEDGVTRPLHLTVRLARRR